MASNLSTWLQFGKQCGKYSILPCRQMSTAAIPKQKSSIKPKTGILMLNMGGPTHIEQVQEYLLRIMTDREMIQLPVQSQLGPWIAKRRTPDVQKKYAEIGGGSPILKWTNKQGELLCKQLDNVSPETAPHKYYVGFRYADPLTEDTLEEINEDGVQHTVIFSQYPQYSCATTGSSFNAIYQFYKKRHLPANMKWSIIDRWATHPLYIKTIAERIKEELVHFPENIRDDVIILFSAHSLPLKAVNRGDSYPSEVGATVALVMQELNYCNPYNLVWQSKVGPLPWLAPFTDDALKAYVKQGKKNFILVPVAFVNEHIETLHEMDIEYCKELAEELGIEKIRRSAAPNDHPIFIDALTDIVLSHLKSKRSISPKFLTRCPHCVNQNCLSSKNWYSQVCKS
ncbi:ferrochelatase, mitochondrial isoform X1 [Hylaeus volcanicus]|uniref:ferrochelatase, mitochondrial isoform X1 n=2 Tax=Hylaeus volcanicus TaxID=313075 RepID=UPI0023B7A5B0|nr:ferrochelatase, mitochondrial isoform X1 [Hylaeus volcanicus]